jgi:hypothetical protein
MIKFVVAVIAAVAVSAPSANAAPDGKGASAARLEADVRFLASDTLEGREAGTRGYDIAALFVAERFRALGLAQAGDDGSYFQSVPMVSFAAAPGGKAELRAIGAAGPVALIREQDYFVFPSARTPRAVVEVPAVFVGFGFAAGAHGRDDFAGLDLEGKIAVLIFGAPKFLNSEELAHYRSTAVKRVGERGAVGAVMLYSPTLEALNPFARSVANARGEASLAWRTADGAAFTQTPNIEARAMMSIDGARKLFAAAGRSFDDAIAQSQTDAGMVEGFDLGVRLRLESDSVITETASANVAAILPGSDPKLAAEHLVLTAHLDHEGVKPTPEAGDDEIYNGAMDNASGVAAMLESARLLAASPPRRPVLFLAVTAEEKGLVGSDYFARNPTVPRDSIAAVVNLDMPIATYLFEDVIAFGAERSTMFPAVAAGARAAGVVLSPDPTPEEGFFTRSDQYSFVKQGMPAVFLRPGFANGGEAATATFRKQHYHRPSDEADLVDFGVLKRFTDVQTAVARKIADDRQRPAWKPGDFFGMIFGGAPTTPQ